MITPYQRWRLEQAKIYLDERKDIPVPESTFRLSLCKDKERRRKKRKAVIHSESFFIAQSNPFICSFALMFLIFLSEMVNRILSHSLISIQWKLQKELLPAFSVQWITDALLVVLKFKDIEDRYSFIEPGDGADVASPKQYAGGRAHSSCPSSPQVQGLACVGFERARRRCRPSRDIISTGRTPGSGSSAAR